MDSDTLLAEEDLLKPDPASLRSRSSLFRHSPTISLLIQGKLLQMWLGGNACGVL